MSLLTLLVSLIAAPVVLVTGYFALELLAGLVPLRPLTAPAQGARSVVVIPAHDEEAVIAGTVAALKEEGGSVVLVVADNCLDGTANAACSAGAQVVVRNDPEHRGKGFALAAAREYLRRNPLDVVVIVDADCRIDGRSLLALVQSAALTGRACQAVNLLAPDLRAPPMVQISTFAFLIKNLIRQRALQRLAGRAHLTGTGMALPWAAFDSANLGGSNIVEDLALGLELAERDSAPMLIERATVWSPPASQSGTLVQRSRWEGGFLATAFKTAPRALARSIAHGDLRGILAALDLFIPPVALLFALNLLVFVIAVVGVALGASIWPLAVQIAVGLSALVLLALAWAREGRSFASGATLLRLPLYVFWKLPMYARLIRRGAPTEWLRTGR